MNTLHEIVEWVKRDGEAHAINRLRLKVLATTIREGLALSEVTPETQCSRDCLIAVRKAAAEIVGRPAPGQR